MAHDVFISYSTKDKLAADAVCAELEKNRIRCWIAPRDVAPGRSWGAEIVKAISTSRIMLLIFSANANESPQIQREVERAVNHGVIVMPVRLEDIVPVEALEYFLGGVHWLDSFPPPLERHLENVSRHVTALLGGSQTPEPRERNVSEKPKVVRKKFPRRWLFGAAVLVIAIIVFIAVWSSTINPNPLNTPADTPAYEPANANGPVNKPANGPSNPHANANPAPKPSKPIGGAKK